jgi:hypothetical protein
VIFISQEIQLATQVSQFIIVLPLGCTDGTVDNAPLLLDVPKILLARVADY